MPRQARGLRPHESTRAFFGAELRHRRHHRGLSQDELGRLVLHSGDLIAKVEKAVRWPTEQLAQRCDLVLETGGALSRLLPLVLAERTAHGPDDDAVPAQPRVWIPAESAATVPRPLEHDAIVTALRDVARSGQPGVVLVAGPGGFGKSTLALAACRDQRLSGLFDSIVWVELGPDCGPARLVQVAADICERLGAGRPSPSGPEQAGFRLAEVLGERRVLLVIDNVWTSADLAPFVLGGPATVRLVTSRHTGACRTAAATVPIPPMTDTQIAEILGNGGVRSLRSHDALALATHCRGWPLLASVIGRTVSRDLVGGASEALAVERAVTALHDEGPEAFDVEDVDQHVATIGRVMRSSLDHLDRTVTLRGGSDLSDRYLDLAVFPPAVPIPVSILAQWWASEHGWTPTAVRQFARVLDERSLLASYHTGDDTLVLHDVFRSCLLSLARRPVAEVHKSFVTAVGALAPHGWHRLDAGQSYLWRHLIHHLEGAGLWKETVGLLADPRYVVTRLRVCGSAPSVGDQQILDRNPDPVGDPLYDTAQALIRSAPLAADADSAADSAATLLVGLAWAGRLRGPQADELRASGSILTRWALPSIEPTDGHTGAIIGVAADADRIVSGGEDGTVRIWDRAAGRLLRTLRGHHGWVYSVAVSAAADVVVSAGDDATIRLWRASTGEPLGALPGHTKRVRSLALARDDQLIVSAGEDGAVIIWSIERLVRERELTTDLRPVWSVAVGGSSDDAVVAVGGQHRSVRLHGLDDGRLLAESEDSHTDWVRAVAFAPGTPLLASGSGDGTVSLWSATPHGLTLLRRTPIDQRVRTLALSAGAEHVLAAGESAVVHDITASAATTIATMPDGVDWIRAVADAPGAGLVIGCEDGGLRELRQDTGTDRYSTVELAAGRGTVWSAAFTPDGDRAMFGTHDGAIRVLAAETAEPVAELGAGTGRVWSVAAGGDVVAAACGDGTMRAWHTSDPQLITADHDEEGRAWDVDIDPSGRRLATSYGFGVVTVRDLGSGDLLWRHHAHRGRIRSLAFAHDGRLLVTGGGDGATRIWDTVTGNMVTELTAGAGWVRAVTIDDDAMTVASGLGSGDIVVAPANRALAADNPATDGAVRHLFGHTGRVLRLAFQSPDRLISAAADGTVRLWSIPDRRQLAQVRVDASLQCAAIHPATGTVAAASATGVVALHLPEPAQET